MSRVLKNIDMTLDDDSIEKAIREVNSFRKQLQDALDALCERLLDEGVEVVKMQILSMPAVDTGALMASIGHGAFDRTSGTGVIYAGAYYAMFVEFGTGIVGKANPHPMAGKVDSAVLGMNGSVYDRYDTNKHGNDGWFYRAVGENGYSWTKGMPARPFMYNAGITLEGYAREHGAEIIAEYIRSGG